MAVDTRFYELLGPLSADDIASLAGGQLVGEGGREVHQIAAPAKAGRGDLFFLTDPKAADAVQASDAVILVSDPLVAERLASAGNSAVVTSSPRAALARAARHLIRPREHLGESLISADAEIDGSARLSPGCIIGPGARIGADARIGAGAVIGPGVEIGASTRIGARAAIGFSLIGERCEISAGAILGETGFGLAYENGEMLTLPHVGRVILDDEITLGANVTIDRGMFDDTHLKKGVRVDNLSHIAHNVVVGEYTVMAAFAGVSGSVRIGRGVQFGGRVGVADHLEVGDQARLAADCAIMRDVPAGETWAGSPAQPIRNFMRETAWIRRESERARKRRSKTS